MKLLELPVIQASSGNQLLNIEDLQKIQGWVKNLIVNNDLRNWFNSIKPHNHRYHGAFGETLEIMCDPTSIPNSSKIADLQGILECKGRIITKSGKLTLFGEKPTKFFKDKEFLFHRVSASSFEITFGKTKNDCQLFLGDDTLYVCHNQFGKILEWDLNVLYERYTKKFLSVISAEAIERIYRGKMQFKIVKLKLFLNSGNFSRFLNLLQDSTIKLSINKQWGEFSFRLSHKDSDTLFGNSIDLQF